MAAGIRLAQIKMFFKRLGRKFVRVKQTTGFSNKPNLQFQTNRLHFKQTTSIQTTNNVCLYHGGCAYVEMTCGACIGAGGACDIVGVGVGGLGFGVAIATGAGLGGVVMASSPIASMTARSSYR